MSAKQVERLEKTLARVAREKGLDQERLRRWVSFLALCGVLEQAVEQGVIDTYYLKGGVAMELRFARAARTTKDLTWLWRATGRSAYEGWEMCCSWSSMHSRSG